MAISNTNSDGIAHIAARASTVIVIVMIRAVRQVSRVEEVEIAEKTTAAMFVRGFALKCHDKHHGVLKGQSSSPMP